MNKKALVSVSGGVAYAYADHGVDVVVVDFDELKHMRPDDVVPIHSSFSHLMELAGILGGWPVGSGENALSDAATHPDDLLAKPAAASGANIPVPVLNVFGQAWRLNAMLNFIHRVASLKKWREPDEESFGRPFEPSDGADHSHRCLMGLIDEARGLMPRFGDGKAVSHSGKMMKVTK